MKKVSFDTLWRSYPASSDPCSGPFSNQCAIRFSEALLSNGISMGSFTGVRCWGDKGSNNGKHAIRAEEVAKWLKRQPIPNMGRTEIIDPKKYQSLLRNKTGFIFFKDYWTRSKETFENRSGDHIDLWNKNRTSGNWVSWSRDLWEWALDDVSDRNASKAVWFWHYQ